MRAQGMCIYTVPSLVGLLLAEGAVGHVAELADIVQLPILDECSVLEHFHQDVLALISLATGNGHILAILSQKQ